MLLSRTTCYLAALLLLSGLSASVLAADSLKQQAPLELPKTLNDLELPVPSDNAKSDLVKKAVKSEATVKSHTSEVLRKLGVENRTQATGLYLQWLQQLGSDA
jgi:hypothetical protein